MACFNATHLLEGLHEEEGVMQELGEAALTHVGLFPAQAVFRRLPADFLNQVGGALDHFLDVHVPSHRGHAVTHQGTRRTQVLQAVDGRSE